MRKINETPVFFETRTFQTYDKQMSISYYGATIRTTQPTAHFHLMTKFKQTVQMFSVEQPRSKLLTNVTIGTTTAGFMMFL